MRTFDFDEGAPRATSRFARRTALAGAVLILAVEVMPTLGCSGDHGQPGAGGSQAGGSSAGGTGGALAGSGGRGGTGGALAGSGGSAVPTGGVASGSGGAGGGVLGAAGTSGGTGGAVSGAAGVAGTSGAAGTGAGGTTGTGGAAGAGDAAGSGGSAGGAVAGQGGTIGGGGAAGTGGTAGFTLTSPAFTNGMMFPADNTCAGANASPELDWTAGPSGTMSYAVVLVDLTGGLAQWAIWNIPPDVRSLPAMLPSDATLSSPAGAMQVSSSGHAYAGPCPNGSTHSYYFVVYALPVANVPKLTSSSSPETAHIVLTTMGPSTLLFGTSDAKSP